MTAKGNRNMNQIVDMRETGCLPFIVVKRRLTDLVNNIFC